MDLREKEAELLSLLRREMNGAVADSMREKGLEYGLNYGVSIADIRSVSLLFAPDHSLAINLYPSQVRELRLAALFIADPTAVTADDIAFWAAGITTTEVAANAALRLFSKTPVTGEIISTLFDSGRLLPQYCAVMTAAANIMHLKRLPEWDYAGLASRIGSEREADPAKWASGPLAEALEALSIRAGAYIPENG